MPAPTTELHRATPFRDLFLASALFLFLELAFIRWLPAQVLYLTFFTNTVLLASFLGLSLGCLAARRKIDWLRLAPALLVTLIASASAMEWIRLKLQNVIDLGHNAASPQVVYFGAELRVGDVASFVVPIELVAGFFFLLVALAMVGPGQLIGRCFASLPNPVAAYTTNIAGSLAGIIAFSICSWYLPPVWWFGFAAVGLIYFLLPNARRNWLPIALAVVAPLLLIPPHELGLGIIRQLFPTEIWSPYYRINYLPNLRSIVANLISQQTMISRNDRYPPYAIPYLLNRDSGQPQFHDILIIGAGSGNDVSRAIQWGASDVHIDAVEIDPVIQGLGQRDHPDRPYQDPRVSVHIGDGRNFLRSTERKYDLIVFALVDSLVLHSSVSNLRLESYVFTRESLEDVRRRLKPDGLFVMYNYFRQGWIVSRLDQTATDAFGRSPIVLTLPYHDRVPADSKADAFTMLFEGPRAEAIDSVFKARGTYFLSPDEVPSPSSPDGFTVTSTPRFLKFSPASVEIPANLRDAEDAWPFLYLRNPMIPTLSWRGMIVIAIVATVMLWLFGRHSDLLVFKALNARMFFLGAGFMLLETKGIVHMALIFGGTWIVNTVVFSAILIMILCANLWAERWKSGNTSWFYIALLALLAANVAVPLNAFLGQPGFVQGIAGGLLVFSPIFCAGVVFARTIARASEPDQALAWNIAGAIFGGLTETLSLLIGFKWLMAVAAILYAASWAFGAAKQMRRTAS